MRRTGIMRRGTGASSPEERQRSLSEWSARMVNATQGKLTKPGIVAGRVALSKGNLAGKPVPVTFQKANTPTFVGHGLGYVVLNFEATSVTPPAKIGLSSRRATKLGIWLEADVPCKAIIICSGERGQAPRSRT